MTQHDCHLTEERQRIAVGPPHPGGPTATLVEFFLNDEGRQRFPAFVRTISPERRQLLNAITPFWIKDFQVDQYTAGPSWPPAH